MKRFLNNPMNVLGTILWSFALLLVILAIGCPIKNETTVYEIPEWGKYTCITNKGWFAKNKQTECWLLVAEPKMVEFINTWNKNEKK